MLDSPARFVVDTHALWWYLIAPERLTATVSAIFRLAETGNATLIVPAITVAEFYFISTKLRRPFPPSALLAVLDAVDGIETTDLGRAQLERLDRFPEIPEMHDRLIVAEAAGLDAPLVTRDQVIRASPQIETIW